MNTDQAATPTGIGGRRFFWNNPTMKTHLFLGVALCLGVSSCSSPQTEVASTPTATLTPRQNKAEKLREEKEEKIRIEVLKEEHERERFLRQADAAEAEVTRKDSAPASESDTDQFLAKIRSIEGDQFVVSADLLDADDTHKTVSVTVNDDWHIQPYQMRLQRAQGWWAVWAQVHSAKGSGADEYGIWIFDGMGNHVGGSTPPTGSIVRVND